MTLTEGKWTGDRRATVSALLCEGDSVLAMPVRQFLDAICQAQ